MDHRPLSVPRPTRPRTHRRAGRRLRLHLAVLHRLRGLRAVPAPVHLLGLPARLEPARRPHLDRPRQLHGAARRRPLLERPGQHARDLRARHRPAAADGAGAGPAAQPAAPRPHASGGWACCSRTSPRSPRSGIIFTLLFARDFGLVNWLLGQVGVEPIDWQEHRWSSWLAISMMVDWRWTGYNALIFLAALQAVPEATSTRRPRSTAPRRSGSSGSITVPMLRPTIIFVTLISTIGGIQLFTEPLLFNSRRQRDQRRHHPPVPDPDDVPLREGVRRPGVRLRLHDRLGDVPGDRARRRHQRAAPPPAPDGGLR